MKSGTRGLTVEQRDWLRTLCKACAEDVEARPALPAAIRDALMAKGLIEPRGSYFDVTNAGFAEAFRTA